MKRRHFAKRLTAKEKAVAPNMLQAVIDAEQRSVEECEERLRGGAMPEPFKVLSLFAGIGGFDLGLERTGGFRTVAFVEKDKACQRVLAKHWEGVPIYEDVSTFSGDQLDTPIDVLVGGYPCQPFSHAGERRGAEDDRHLWPEMHRLMDELRPSWVIGENVAGHVSMGLDTVLSDLESLGYSSRSFVIPACAVNAPHRRDRVWVVAHSERERPTVRAAGQGGEGAVYLPHGHNSERPIQFGAAGDGQVLADADSPGQREQRRPIPIRAQLAAVECGSWWSSEPAVGRVADGLPGRVDRLKQLGNAVVPQIPELIGRAILAAEGGRPHDRA